MQVVPQDQEELEGWQDLILLFQVSIYSPRKKNDWIQLMQISLMLFTRAVEF